PPSITSPSRPSACSTSSLFLLSRRPPCSTLFPYTTLFRSLEAGYPRMAWAARPVQCAAARPVRVFLPCETAGADGIAPRHATCCPHPPGESQSMIELGHIDDLARRLSSLVPASVRESREEMQENFKAVLQGGLAKLDLVTREEFEVQRAVLLRT